MNRDEWAAGICFVGLAGTGIVLAWLGEPAGMAAALAGALGLIELSANVRLRKAYLRLSRDRQRLNYLVTALLALRLSRTYSGKTAMRN